jgi:6-phospho-3-hexuloisomerase
MSTPLNIVRSEMDAVLAQVDEAAIDPLVDLLVAAPRVFTAGEGRSGFMAKAFAMRLMHLGLTVYAVGETITPGFDNADVLLAVSGSGTTPGTLRAAQQAREKGGTVLAVTTDTRSPLAELAVEVLDVPAATKQRSAGEATTQQPLGSLFDQCTHVLLDAICLEIARRRDVSLDEARSQHASE